MKVMISQPMRGKTNEQIRQEREELVKELEMQGYEVVDTIFADETPIDSDIAMYFLSKSIEAMAKVDGIIFMPGWKEASGCKIEYRIALEYGKFIKVLN